MRWTMWKLAAALLLLQSVSFQPSEARGFSGGGGGRGYGGNYAGGRGYGYGGSYANGWWGGGGFGLNGGDTNSSYYFSPAQTSLPAVAAQDDTDVEEKAADRVPHQSGPSMSFQSMMPQSTTDTFAQFNQDFSQIAGPVTYVPVPYPAGNGSTSASLKPPRINCKYPSLAKASVSGTFSPTFSSGAADFSSQVQSKIVSVQALLTQSKNNGQLGTFDVAPLQSRLDNIKSRFAAASNDANAQEQMLNDLSQLEYDINQHSGS